MLRYARHHKYIVFNSRRGQFVPVRLDEATSNAVDFSKSIQVADIDFARLNPDDRTILLMKLVNIKGSLADQSLVLQHSICKPGVPRSWYRMERTIEPFAERLCLCEHSRC